MKVCYEGIGELCATFSCGNLAEGAPVIAGVVKAVSRGKDACSVQLRGFVTLPYSGTTAPSLGYNALEADGAGGVKVGESSARERLVVEVDATAGKVTFLL